MTDRVLTPREVSMVRASYAQTPSALAADGANEFYDERIAELCASHERLRAERDLLRAAGETILHDPYGCPYCDSGVLRKRVDGAEPFHADDCGWKLLRAAVDAFDKEG